MGVSPCWVRGGWAAAYPGFQPAHSVPQPQPQFAYASAPQAVHVPTYVANVGPCAAGGGHEIREEFTACGLVCGILLFPIGLICCLTMKDRTCLRCGMKFS